MFGPLIGYVNFAKTWQHSVNRCLKHGKSQLWTLQTKLIEVRSVVRYSPFMDFIPTESPLSVKVEFTGDHIPRKRKERTQCMSTS